VSDTDNTRIGPYSTLWLNLEIPSSVLVITIAALLHPLIVNNDISHSNEKKLFIDNPNNARLFDFIQTSGAVFKFVLQGFHMFIVLIILPYLHLACTL